MHLSVVVPPAQVGESLYSVCARAHILSNYSDARVTSTQLLGHRRGPFHHAVPFGLAHFDRASEGRFPATEELLRRYTILGAYLPLMSAIERFATIRRCSLSTGGPAQTVRKNFALQLARPQELRLCPGCVEEDLRSLSFCYWRVAHQMPGVWVCLVHSLPLFSAPRASRKVAVWRSADHARSESLQTPVFPATFEPLQRVAQCMAWLVSQTSVTTHALAAMVRKRLFDDGFVKTEVKASRAEVSELQRLSMTLILSGATPFAGLLHKRWIRDTLLDGRASDPVRWCTLLAFCGDVSAAQLNRQLLAATARLPQRDLFDEAYGPHRAHAPEEFYRAFTGPTSKTAAAKKLQISITQASSWLHRDPELRRHWRTTALQVRNGAAQFTIAGYLRSNPQATRMQTIRSCLWAVRQLEANDPTLLVHLLPRSEAKYDRQLRFLFQEQ